MLVVDSSSAFLWDLIVTGVYFRPSIRMRMEYSNPTKKEF
jgi:hypothetical protein